MNGAISVINSGSSSIKFSLFQCIGATELTLIYRGQVDGIGVTPKFVGKNAAGDIVEEQTWQNSPEVNHESLMTHIIRWIRENRLKLNQELLGVGHRVVHGGNAYSHPVKLDDTVLQKLEEFIPLAPLHQPHNLSPIRTVTKLNPEIPQVACFDTAFHSTNPVHARMYALPRDLIREGVVRYGFHGLSYEFIARQLPVVDPNAAKGRVAVAHLGNGASMCGLLNGESITNSMGFTAIEGLVMGTRTGSLDPGVILYLMQTKQMDAAALEEMLYKQSGLQGMSEISNDMRILLESDDPQAKEAVDVFVYRIQRELGATAAVLGGLDALVFTAGIGENAAEIRSRVCEGSEWLGIRLDPDANRAGGPRINSDDSVVSVWVIPTNEELMIAMHTRDVLAKRGSGI
jgi:acetate kinase